MLFVYFSTLLESILKSGLLPSALLAGENWVGIVGVGIVGVGIIAPTHSKFWSSWCISKNWLELKIKLTLENLAFFPLENFAFFETAFDQIWPFYIYLKSGNPEYFSQELRFFWVGAIMPTPTIPTPTISTQFLPANNADGSNPDFNIDSNNVEK